jgi:hypothetical protein
VYRARTIVLRDLVAGRKVGVEVVLPVECRAALDSGLERDTGAHCQLHALWVEGLAEAVRSGLQVTRICKLTGSVPGNAASNGVTFVFVSAWGSSTRASFISFRHACSSSPSNIAYWRTASRAT